MSNDTMQDALIEDSAARLFSTQVDKDRRLRAETGEWDAALWRQITDSGFHLLLATEAAGGFGEGWTAAYPLLRGLGYWQVPPPAHVNGVQQIVKMSQGWPSALGTNVMRPNLAGTSRFSSTFILVICSLSW